MIDEQTKTVLNDIGKKLALTLPMFYGKVTFNFQNGNYVSSNVEQSIRITEPLKKGAKNED